MSDGDNRRNLDGLTREAANLGRRGDWGPQGIRLNTEILEQDPDNLAALIRRGRCFLEGDDYSAAREDYSRALQVDPGSTPARSGLSRVQAGWDAGLARAEKRAAKKRAQAEELRRVEALTDFEKARSTGIAATDRNPPDYTLAIAAFRKAYRLDPRRKLGPGGRPPAGLFEVPTRLARVYRKSGRLDQAQKTYEWILRHRDSLHAKVGLAAVHEDRRRHSMALELYEEVLGEDPRSPAALRGKARTLASLDRAEEAVEAYSRAEYFGGSGR